MAGWHYTNTLSVCTSPEWPPIHLIKVANCLRSFSLAHTVEELTSAVAAAPPVASRRPRCCRWRGRRPPRTSLIASRRSLASGETKGIRRSSVAGTKRTIRPDIKTVCCLMQKGSFELNECFFSLRVFVA